MKVPQAALRVACETFFPKKLSKIGHCPYHTHLGEFCQPENVALDSLMLPMRNPFLYIIINISENRLYNRRGEQGILPSHQHFPVLYVESFLSIFLCAFKCTVV